MKEKDSDILDANTSVTEEKSSNQSNSIPESPNKEPVLNSQVGKNPVLGKDPSSLNPQHDQNALENFKVKWEEPVTDSEIESDSENGTQKNDQIAENLECSDKTFDEPVEDSEKDELQELERTLLESDPENDEVDIGNDSLIIDEDSLESDLKSDDEKPTAVVQEDVAKNNKKEGSPESVIEKTYKDIEKQETDRMEIQIKNELNSKAVPKPLLHLQASMLKNNKM